MIYTKGPNHDLRFLLSLAGLLDLSRLSIIVDNNDIVVAPYRTKQFSAYTSQFIASVPPRKQIATDLKITIKNCNFYGSISL